MTHRIGALGAVLGVMLLPLVLSAQTFRSGVLMVPVDVRVLDADGEPLSGLVKDDFVVFEDGVVQPIVQFSADWLPATGLDSAERRPAGRRIFLIDANRDWLGVLYPGFGIVEAMVRFIESLGPDDLVGFSARYRITDLTTDHASVIEVIRRYEAFLRSVYERDQGALTGRLESIRFEPPGSELLVALDEVFAPATGRSRSTKLAPPKFGKLIDQIGRESYDAAQNGSAKQDQRYAESMAMLQKGVARNLLGDIDVLKNFEGEKHIISLGITAMGTADSDRRITALASAARVSIHVIRVSDPRVTKRDTDMSMQALARETGGLAFLERMPRDAFAAIDRFSGSAAYHLGYVAPTSTLDGRTHNITVQLRKGLKGRVITRGSYVASPMVSLAEAEALTMRETVLQALASRLTLKGVAVKASVSLPSARVVNVEATIGVDGLVRPDGEAFVGRAEVAVFAYDRSGDLVTEDWKSMNLNLSAATHDRLSVSGLKHAVSLEVSRDVKSVHVIVYDHTTGAVGSAIVQVK